MPPRTIEKKYPLYMISRIFSLIVFKYERMDFSKHLTWGGFLEDVSIMMTTGLFTKERIEILLETVIGCLRSETYMHIIKTSTAISSFYKVCDEITALDVNISKFLRFIIISEVQTCTTKMLFDKRMLYLKHGELVICQYITRKFNVALERENPLWFDIQCVEGISPVSLFGEAFVLDEYYLEYEKKHSPDSFVV